MNEEQEIKRQHELALINTFKMEQERYGTEYALNEFIRRF